MGGHLHTVHSRPYRLYAIGSSHALGLHYVESPMWSNAVLARHRWTTRDPGGIYTGFWLDIPEKSPACYGVLPPFKTIEIHPFFVREWFINP